MSVITEISTELSGKAMALAVNDRIRQINIALRQATTGATGGTGATGATGAAGSSGGSSTTGSDQLSYD